MKFIVVTGGVISGLGKGIASASIGKLFSNEYKVVPIKCDGYLNIDPGTMNPIEHGEVFVLDDGGEVDMDFGHYERFLNISAKIKWNLTMGKVYKGILDKERKGDFLGKTVQLIPHVTNHIKDWFYDIALEEKANIVIIEVGGTVGDMENELYIEATRQLKNDLGRENVFYVHLTYIPIPNGVNEPKSKPTQQSVKLLNERGIWPDMIIGRCQEYIPEQLKEKIANFCNVSKESIVTGVDVDSVYKIPIEFKEQNVDDTINAKFKLTHNADLEKWKHLVESLSYNMNGQKKVITIAICGKYTRLEDSYASVVEALMHSSAHLDCKVNIKWVETTKIETLDDAKKALAGIDGIIVPGGFGSRGVEGKVKIIHCARENDIPFLGICYGLQLAVIEFARNVCGLTDANSTEIDKDTTNPVVDILPEQITITEKGGTMRLGAYEANIKKGTKIFELYESEKVSERHRHRYEVNPEFHKILSDKGLVFSGLSPNGKLVEFIELPEKTYFVGTQAHPELKSSLTKPAPMFYGLVLSAVTKKFGKNN
ncbi:CTP synthase (glutamine hydrolyzing) [Candidatus Woesearchaeota archaeon]|nr:CTP synthase (glutamine hydrolyzing) [Candidatus Woesearchaeota archaeon]